MRRQIVVFTTALFSGAVALPVAMTQTPAEHQQHHAEAPTSQAPRGQSSMMQMMRDVDAPVRQPPLYSALLMPPDDAVQRKEGLLTEANARIDVGIGLVRAGAAHLDEAWQRQDRAAIHGAVGMMRDGLERFETGQAVQRALQPASTPLAPIGMHWFKDQMKVEPMASATPWGFSWFHWTVMALIASVALIGLLLYAYKINRALQLLAEATRK